MHSRLAENKSTFDAVIIGGGPAGASCALWLKMLGYLPCIIEKRASLGGLQNESPYPNQWIAALPGLTGQQVASSIQKNILSHNIMVYLESTVTHIEKIENGYRVHFNDSQQLSCIAFAPNLVLATGVKPANDGLQASANLLIGPGKQIANYSFTNKTVAILGGGDSAFENYEFIKKRDALSVHIHAQQDKKHEIKARCEFLERMPEENLFIHQEALVINDEKMTVNDKQYDAMIVLFGWTANLPILSNFKLKLNEKGFVETNDKTAETSEQNIYAIGEVAQRHHPCCATAMSDGVVAAKAIQNRIEFAKKLSFFYKRKSDHEPQSQPDMQFKARL